MVDYYIKSKRKEQLAESELLPEQSPLNKILEEIAGNIDKAENTCEKLMILIEKSNILEEQLRNICLKKHTWEKL